jgi:tetratricopeptide (TPR) repeat protein
MDVPRNLRVFRDRARVGLWLLGVLLGVAPSVAAQQQPRGITPRRSSVVGTRRAVVIGVSKYGQFGPDRQLAYAAADARLFYAFLTSRAGGPVPPENVRLLVDTAATGSKIWEALTWLGRSSKQDDQAIVYFAGHGDVEEATGAETGFLLAHDAPVGRLYPVGGAISISQLQDLTTTLARRGVQVIVVTDACRAGKLVGTPEGAARTTSALLAEWTRATRLVSSQANQLSREGPEWGGGHGVFTYYLVDGLLGSANRDGDGAVTPLEIKRYLLEQVPRATSDQQVPEVLGELEETLAVADAASRQLVLGRNADSISIAAGAASPPGPGRVSTAEARYQAIRARIEHGDLLNPPDSSAWDLLRRSGVGDLPNARRAELTTMLSTALLTDAQRVVNAYIQGGNNLPSPASFREAAREIEIASAGLDKGDPRIPSLRATKTFLEGYAFVRQGKSAYGIPILKQSLALARTPYAMNALAAAYVNAQRGDSGEALLREVMHVMPHWAFPFNTLGAIYHRQGRYDQAVQTFERAIAADSSYGKAYANLGGSLRRLGRTEDAARAWERAMQVDLENSANLIANYLIRDEKNPAAADSVYESALSRAPASLITMVRKGDLLKSSGKLDEAEREYRRAIATSPDSALAYSGLGTVFEARFDQSGDSTLLDSAAASFQRASTLAPQEPVFARNAGIIAFRRGHFELADSAVRYAIRLDSLDAGSFSTLGELLGTRGRHREAAAAYERAIRLDQRNMDLYLALAAAREESKQYAEAERVYRRALAIEPQSAAVYTALGGLYRKLGRVADAVRAYRRALELDPKATDAQEALKAIESPAPTPRKP